MTISQAAKYLRVSTETLKRWGKQKRIVPPRAGKRNDRVYSMDIINQFLKSCE